MTAAVQPTAFKIRSYEISEVFDTPDLIQNLALYAARPDRRPHNSSIALTADGKESLLFLRVQATADFFTTNTTRMLDPPRVDIDLILDPYLWNVFPRSLGPTAAYIVVLATGGCMESMDEITDDDAQPIGNIATPNDNSTAMITTVPPRHPFYAMPSELIFDIVDLLPPEAFINLAFANYPLLSANGLAPALSRPRVAYITTNTRLPALFPLIRMPAEITLQIMRHLRPLDVMRFVVANYQDLARQGIAPPMTAEMISQLRIATTPQDSERESTEALLSANANNDASDPPAYSAEVRPPAYPALYCRTYTSPYLLVPAQQFQYEATFFTHVKIIFPEWSRMLVPPRTIHLGPAFMTSIEPVRLSYKCTFDALQLVLKAELEKREISTMVARGYHLVGRIKTVLKQRRSKAGWRARLGRRSTEPDVEVAVEVLVREDNWAKVLEGLSTQEIRGLELTVWTEVMPREWGIRGIWA
nr:hypothetical protein B0A51_02720 [Rachicladosporium sp. CCFEE 5018]